MKIAHIYKRDQTKQPFKLDKIASAILQAMLSIGKDDEEEAVRLAASVHAELLNRKNKLKNYLPNIEEIQDIVEQTLMKNQHFDVAKSYILYREKQNSRRQRNIFEKRLNLKPYEYPELYEYVPAIRHSYWIHTEFNFTSDIQDFKTKLNDTERSAIKNTMLAISQIEVSVKSFWGDIYHRIPKPEVGSVGATFAESEVRHADAYSHLLEILGLNTEFEEIEHVSLFSQFLIIMAFNKHKNMLKGVSNVVEATSKEEQIHGDFGIDLIKIIKAENPDWFDVMFSSKIQQMCKEAFEAESAIIDWIFEKGEIDFLPKNIINEFIKDRFNRSLESIGIGSVFAIDADLLKQTEWFDDEIIGTKHGDFFVKRSINYSKRTQSVTADDLF